MKPSALLIILLIAFVLRVAPINQPLWYDEAYTASLAQMPLDQMWAQTVADVHGPLWYLIAGASVRLLGATEFALRFPSLVLGMLCVWLTYRLALALELERRVALVAAGLMAFNPLAVYHSGESRMYSLLLASVLLASWGSATGKRWAVGLGTALTLFSHNLGVIYLPGIALLAGRARIKRVLPAMALGVLPYALWLPSLVYQMSHNQFSASYWISYFIGNPFAGLLSNMVQLWLPHFRYDVTARVGALVVYALLMFPAVAAVRARNRQMLVLLAITIMPMLAELSVSLVWQPIILARTLIGTLPAWCLLAGWWLGLPRAWNPQKVALVSIAGCIVFSCNIALLNYGRGQFMPQMLDAVKRVGAPGDLVCHTGPSSQIWFEFYQPGRSVVISTVDPNTCRFIVYGKSVWPDPNIDLADTILASHPHETLITAFATGDVLIELYQVH